MPKPVDDLVETLLKNPDFYPEKSEKQQKSIAFAIAWKQYNASKVKKKRRKSSDYLMNIRVATDLLSYSNKLELNGNYFESDNLIKIANDLLIK